jgi:hypothetical protein
MNKENNISMQGVLLDGFISDNKENFKFYNEDELKLTFKVACKAGQLDLVQYILSDKDLASNFNEDDMEDGFLQAFNAKQIEIIRYFIFDIDIEQTLNINNSFQVYLSVEKEFNDNKGIIGSTGLYVSQIKNMFNLRNLNQKLQDELPIEKTNHKKLKL